MTDTPIRRGFTYDPDHKQMWSLLGCGELRASDRMIRIICGDGNASYAGKGRSALGDKRK
jgi:hypothetical protein